VERNVQVGRNRVKRREDEENMLIGEEEVHKEKEGAIFAVHHSDETKDFSKEKKAQKLRQQELEVEIVF